MAKRTKNSGNGNGEQHHMTLKDFRKQLADLALSDKERGKILHRLAMASLYHIQKSSNTTPALEFYSKMAKDEILAPAHLFKEWVSRYGGCYLHPQTQTFKMKQNPQIDLGTANENPFYLSKKNDDKAKKTCQIVKGLRRLMKKYEGAKPDELDALDLTPENKKILAKIAGLVDDLQVK